jgi:hypothetical protein
MRIETVAARCLHRHLHGGERHTLRRITPSPPTSSNAGPETRLRTCRRRCHLQMKIGAAVAIGKLRAHKLRLLPLTLD